MVVDPRTIGLRTVHTNKLVSNRYLSSIKEFHRSITCPIRFKESFSLSPHRRKGVTKETVKANKVRMMERIRLKREKEKEEFVLEHVQSIGRILIHIIQRRIMVLTASSKIKS